jgi:hypothetical protein
VGHVYECIVFVNIWKVELCCLLCCARLPIKTSAGITLVYIEIYIYIYMCVCVRMHMHVRACVYVLGVYLLLDT